MIQKPLGFNQPRLPDPGNRELAPWRSLEVIDTLLVLAEGGHTHAVKELFAIPQTHCPGKKCHVWFRIIKNVQQNSTKFKYLQEQK